MRTAIFLLSAALAIPASAARVEQITLDLERPKRAFALSITEQTDTTLRAALRASGAEFDPEGWAGLLWYGTEAGGITITNSTASYGSMTWAVPASAVPTNGRYYVQILGVSGGDTIEEWGLGTLSVRLSPSAGSLPADWLAGNAAYIGATNALSRVTALEGGTDNWNTAFSWGDHAGLYREIGWVPSWGDLTDIPQDFPPSTHEHDYTTITNPPWLTSFTETDEIALSRVTVLEGKTNNWNAAFGWGNHAGLYKNVLWFPLWTEVTGKPDLFDWSYDSLTNVPAAFPPEAHQHDYTAVTNPPWLTEYTETDEIALAALAGTNTILRTAITNEAALRSAGDVANADSLITYADTNHVTRLWDDGGESYALADGTLYQMQIGTNYARAFTNATYGPLTETASGSLVFWFNGSDRPDLVWANEEWRFTDESMFTFLSGSGCATNDTIIELWDSGELP